MHRRIFLACTHLIGALLFTFAPHTLARDPDSDNSWSYAIVLRIDEPTPTTARLEELTDIDYTGLMSDFGVGRDPESPPNEVDIDFEQATDHQAAIDHIHAEQLSPRLAPLAHLPQGEWRTTPANGTQQRDVWTWGPSKHALTSITSNSKATSESVFGSFRVVYHHPQRDELAVLALSGAELIQTGTLTVLDDLDFRFDMTLFYDQERIPWAGERTRTISSVWTFDSPASYTNHWIEDQGQPVDPSATAWAYSQHDDVTPLPANAAEPPEHVEHLGAFLPFLESEWKTDTTRTTFSWIPYNEAILMRTMDTLVDESIAETIFYPHPHTKTIHALTLHASGAIDEGTVSTDDDGILIQAERAGRATVTQIEQRIGFPSAEAIRIHTWSILGTERMRLAETTHRAATD